MKRSNGILRLIYTITLIGFIAVIVNVFLVSVFKYHFRSGTHIDAYTNSISKQQETLIAKRGNIYSSDGEIVASDIETYDVICILDKNRIGANNKPAYVVDPLETSKVLADVLGANQNDIYTLLTVNQELYQTEIGIYGRNITKQQKEEIDSYNLPGIEYRRSSSRIYLKDSSFAPYLIGYAQTDDTGKLIGKMGLEYYANAELSGVDGVHTYQQDKNGYILSGMYENTVEAVDGYDVYTTIDSSIQDALDTSFDELAEGANEAWGAVVEIDSGKILAWGQNPSFDPNVLDITEYKNYGSMMAYEPGSVFKSIIYAAAIDSGNYNGYETYDSSRFYYGSYGQEPARVYGDSYYGYIDNANGKSWGEIELDYGLIYSSNVATSTLLTDYLGSDLYFEYVKKFGFFDYVDTDGISEVKGTTNFYKSPADKLSLTYGQGSSVTMLQLLQAYSAIFGNGEMVKPYFIDKIVDSNTNTLVYKADRTVVDRVISEDTAKQMQELLTRVVYDKRGTASIYKVDEVSIMAKTGTAEVMSDGSYTRDVYINSVMLAFPAEQPKYMIYYAFVYPYDYGNVDNTSAIKNLIRSVALLTNTENTGSVVNVDSKEYEMPNLINRQRKDINDLVSKFNPSIVYIGDGSTVIGQYPSSKDTVYQASRIILLTDGDNIEMPDFKGWSRKDIIGYWNLSGISININGYGVCDNQSISPGTIISKKDEIDVYMKQLDSYITGKEEIIEETTEEEE